jgi:hypothetical protein
MSIFQRLRVDIRAERAQAELVEDAHTIAKKNGHSRKRVRQHD